MTEFGEKHSDSVKLKAYLYCLTYELYEFVRKLSEFVSFMPNSVTELMLNFDSVLNCELLYSDKPFLYGEPLVINLKKIIKKLI